MKIVAMMSLLGGTGVTLSAAELAYEAALDGKRVLAIDLGAYACLARDLKAGHFQAIEDVRQLFRPLSEARWRRQPLPVNGLLCVPRGRPHWLTADAEGKLSMAFADQPWREPDAARFLAAALADLGTYYELAVVDVPNKDADLMGLFFDHADVVGLHIRQLMNLEELHAKFNTYIGRDELAKGPYEFAMRMTRDGEVVDRDWCQWLRDQRQKRAA